MEKEEIKKQIEKAMEELLDIDMLDLHERRLAQRKIHKVYNILENIVRRMKDE